MFFLYSSTPKRIEDIFTELGPALLDHCQWVDSLEQIDTLANQESTVLFLIFNERPPGAFLQLKERYPHWKVVLLSQQIGEQQLRDWQQGQADFYDLFYKYPVPWPVVSSTLKLVSTFVASSWNKVSVDEDLKLDDSPAGHQLPQQQQDHDHAFLQLTEAAALELDLGDVEKKEQQNGTFAALPSPLEEGFDLSLSQLIAPVEPEPLEVSEQVPEIASLEQGPIAPVPSAELNLLEDVSQTPPDTREEQELLPVASHGYQDWMDQLKWREEKILSLQRKLELFEKDREYAKQKNRELQQQLAVLEKKYALLVTSMKSLLKEAEQPMVKVLHSKADPYDF